MNRRLSAPPSRLQDLIRFALVGGLGFCVDEAVLALVREMTPLGPLGARVVSIACAMTCTWLGNRTFTFARHRAKGMGGMAHEWLRFCAANSFGAVMNYLTYAIAIHRAPYPFDIPYVAVVLGAAAGGFFNFTLSLRLVFRAGRNV